MNIMPMTKQSRGDRSTDRTACSGLVRSVAFSRGISAREPQPKSERRAVLRRSEPGNLPGELGAGCIARRCAEVSAAPLVGNLDRRVAQGTNRPHRGKARIARAAAGGQLSDRRCVIELEQ